MKDMKRILLGIVVMAAFMLASCNNDAINVDVKHTLTMSVLSSSPFDDFGIDYTDYVKTKYLGGGYSVCVESYVYDEEGNAVDSIKQVANTFGRIEMPNLNLLPGNYTVATIEMLVHSGNGLSPYWNIVNSGTLSTLAVIQKDIEEIEKTENLEFISEDGILGISTDKLTVGTDNAKLSISPHVIGSLLDIHYLDFNKSNYKIVSFCTKDAPDGYLLNPELSHLEHYAYTKGYSNDNVWRERSIFKIHENQKGYYDIHDYDVQQVAYILDSNSVNWLFVTCLTTEKIDGEYQFEESASSDGLNSYSTFTFEDGKYYYAGIAYTGKLNEDISSSSIFTSFDDLQVWYSNLDKSWLSLLPPYNVFGASVNDVKAYMSDYVIRTDFDAGSDHYVYYYGEGAIVQYGYIFQSGILREYLIEVYKSKIDKENLIAYFDKRYKRTYTSEDVSGFFFESDNGIRVYISTRYDDYYYISYEKVE